MSRIAFFCLSRSLAHAGRLARLAAALQERGHTPILYGAPGWLAEPALWPDDATPEIVPHPEPSLEDALGGARGQAPTEPEHVVFGRAMLQDIQALARSRPAAVVVDNRRSALVAAESLAIPTLSLTTAALLGPLAAMRMTAADYARVLLPSMGIFGASLAHRPPDEVLPAKPVELPGAMALTMIALKGRPRGYVHELSLGDRTAILDPPAFAPMATLPAGAFQPGPIFPRVRGAEPVIPSGEGPLIYLSFGSTGAPEGLRAAAAALGAGGLRVLASTASIVSDNLGAPSFRLGPVDPILRRAALTVCHGGTLTVYHALSHGCPVLALPGHVEQGWSGVALERSGAGASLAQDTPSRDRALFLETVRRLVADTSVRDAARGLGRVIDGEAALNACAEVVEAML